MLVTMPISVALLVMSELTFCCPDRMYSFLSTHYQPDGSRTGFPVVLAFDTTPELVAELVAHLAANPQLVQQRVPNSTNGYYCLTLPAEMVPAGVAVFDGGDLIDNRAVSVIYMTDELTTAVNDDVEDEPLQLLFDMVHASATNLLEAWLAFNFPPFTNQSGVLN